MVNENDHFYQAPSPFVQQTAAVCSRDPDSLVISFDAGDGLRIVLAKSWLVLNPSTGCRICESVNLSLLACLFLQC